MRLRMLTAVILDFECLTQLPAPPSHYLFPFSPLLGLCHSDAPYHKQNSPRLARLRRYRSQCHELQTHMLSEEAANSGRSREVGEAIGVRG